MSELKPCPWCKAIPYKVGKQSSHFYVPHEQWCYFTYMGDSGYWIEFGAEEAWNRRHDHDD